jgi:predicted ATP-grasp superfamily ATP-dependent carboligase
LLRDPWRLAAAMRAAGLSIPELNDTGALPAGDDWLRKPLRAAGGFGIRRVPTARTIGGHKSGSIYFQKFISGRSLGVTYLGANGRAVLVGATEQLLGPAWGASREFQYVGSVGPATLSQEHVQGLARIGNCIAANFPVRGLFGVDAIANEAGVWPVEVNPRYTASVEIIERVLRVATIGWHVAACRDGKLPELPHDYPPQAGCAQAGKAVVYADRKVFVDAKLERALCARNREHADPVVSDIPPLGTDIHPGEPLVTVFADGATDGEVKDGLRAAIASVKRLT